MLVTLSSAEHGTWKEPIHNWSVGDSSKDVSPRPLLLSWLCLHKCGGVYLRCQDQCWPEINNILRCCTLTTYRLGNINLSHPPCFGDSALLLTPFFTHCEIDGRYFLLSGRRHLNHLTVRLLETAILSSLISSVPLSLSVVFLSCFQCPSQEGTQPWTSGLRTALPVISTAVNIFWTLPLPGWNGNKSHPNNSVLLLPQLSL